MSSQGVLARHEAESRATPKAAFAWWNSCFCYGQIGVWFV